MVCVLSKMVSLVRTKWHSTATHGQVAQLSAQPSGEANTLIGSLESIRKAFTKCHLVNSSSSLRRNHRNSLITKNSSVFASKINVFELLNTCWLLNFTVSNRFFSVPEVRNFQTEISKKLSLLFSFSEFRIYRRILWLVYTPRFRKVVKFWKNWHPISKISWIFLWAFILKISKWKLFSDELFWIH